MRLWIYFGLAVIFSSPVTATELVHRFVDPNFGGNPLNGNFLMSQASGQDRNKEPPVIEPPVDPLKEFSDRLKDSILSGLANATSDKLVDSTTGKIIPNNTVSIGDFSVRVGSEVNGAVSINVTDGISSTELTIPSINSR